jgi:cell division protein FtsQ
MNKTAIHFFIGLIIVLLAGWQGWQEVKAQGADWLPVKYVRIEGAFQFIAKDEIEQVLQQKIINGFYNVDIQQIQASVKALPWVNAVQVKRVWPDAINIKIDEQIAVAKWGDKALINIAGEIFKPVKTLDLTELPLLVGPVGYEKKMLNILRGLSGELATQDMKLTEFHINERRSWEIKLQNKMLLKAGRNQPLKKIQRFLKTVYLITKEQVADIAVVDLRYSNGYALSWKQGEAKKDWKKIAEMNKT